jgi:hypothetical protein
MRIIKKLLQSYIRYETPMEQPGLRKGHGARDQIVTVSKSWTAHGSTTKMSICFIDYTKDFDSVQQSKMWNSIRSLGITKHLTLLIQDLQTM